MPVAVVSTEAQRYPLKSLPADPAKPGPEGEEGFIMARPLPYGMVLDRRDKGSKMTMEQEIQRGRRKKSRNQNEPEMQKIELETLSSWMAKHDFAYCIQDHNLLAANGDKLDFSNAMAVNALDPKVGSEIDRILTELNELEEDDEETMENFTTSPISSSLASPEPLKEVTTPAS